ncbi:MAG: GAF domain-containing protein [Chloroflexi bacterium]|nr:GAF domain-containing protein [Chloroflexota bacterium]
MSTQTCAQRDWQLKILGALHHQSLNQGALLNTALTLVAAAVDVEMGAFVMLDPEHRVDAARAIGLAMPGEDDADAFWTALVSQGLIGFVMHSRRPVAIRDLSTDLRWPQPIQAWPQTGAALGLPIQIDDQLEGVLILIHPDIDHFNEAMVDWLMELSPAVAAALRNARLFSTAQSNAAYYHRRYEQARRESAKRQQTDRLRRDLTAMIYHDLRAPIQNVQLSLSGLRRLVPDLDDNRLDELFDLGLASAHRMTQMVQGMLDLERLEEGRTILNRRPTALPDLLALVEQQTRPTAEAARQSLTFFNADQLPPMQIDPDVITRVLINLIENASKHTPPGGHIMVDAVPTDDGVQIAVSDTGPGIPQEYQDKIFDKFFQVTAEKSARNFGLGLAFCRLAVEAHGGTISVSNQPEGGAVFAVTLPTAALMAAELLAPALKAS